jgi:site-specific recombinase XerD
LAKFYRRSPDQITHEEVQAYLLHLIRERKLAWSTCNIAVHGLRFLSHTTLGHDTVAFHIPGPRQRSKLPLILSRDEVRRILAAATHWLEAGVPLPTIQRLLGHRSLQATARYLHLAQVAGVAPGSPLDLLDRLDLARP